MLIMNLVYRKDRVGQHMIRIEIIQFSNINSETNK